MAEADDISADVGNEESRGEVWGIETSLRRPCDPAPVLAEASSSLISTGIADGGCEDDEGLKGTEAGPPVDDCGAGIIGWMLWACEMPVCYGDSEPSATRRSLAMQGKTAESRTVLEEG